MDIYRHNKIGNATIGTPIGNVGPVKANEIVSQGTIIGPKLCCINTDKINNIGRKCSYNKYRTKHKITNANLCW